ncbi:MAG: DUF3000 family protein [Rhodoluna sp.]
MTFFELNDKAPAEFKVAAAPLATPYTRSELDTTQIASPHGIGPFSLAFSAQVPDSTETPLNRGVGRIVFVHDPEQADVWGANMRVIAYAKSPAELDLGKEDDSANYYWELLSRALANHSAKYTAEAGTITKMSSTGMGSIATDKPSTEIELRASWTPLDGNLQPHLAAWQDLVAAMAGFALEGESVIPLSQIS